MGNYSLNDPDLATAVGMKKEKKEQECTDITMKLYKKKKKDYDLGIKTRELKRKWNLYQYDHILNFKQLHFRNLSRNETSTEGQQKIKIPLPTKLADRILLLDTFKNYPEPHSLVEPTGYKKWLAQDVLNDLEKKCKKLEAAQAIQAHKPTIMMDV